MNYDQERGGIIIENAPDVELASWVIHAARVHDDPKEKKRRPDPVAIKPPYLLQGTAGYGLLNAMRRAAEGETDISPELQALAADTYARLNEEMGIQKDPNFLGRIASLAAKLQFLP